MCGTGLSHDVEGFVLAGGQSSRMGRDKALVELAGRSLVAHAVDTLRNTSLAVSIAGSRSDLSCFAPVVPDIEQDLGPLSGVCNALEHATAEWVVLLPVDLPLLPSALIGYLVSHARITGKMVTLASVNGFAQTFPAAIRREAIFVLKRELRAGRSGCITAFRAVAEYYAQSLSVAPVEYIVQAGQCDSPGNLPPARWFQNVNSPGDLAHASQCFNSALPRIA
jgi:molybdenum cofactor guanylyltransferase